MDNRRTPRFRATFPVEVEPAGGVMIDMSSSGVAFETTYDYHPGDEISVRVILGRKAGPALDLRCSGKVVRVEKKGASSRVAATVEWAEDDVLAGRETFL